MQSNRTLYTPTESLAPASPVGRSRMIITHTHPTFTDSTQRMEQLRDLRKTCARLAQAQRKKQVMSA